jgi:c-di-GMP-binding flagellar brake protein YcgR
MQHTRRPVHNWPRRPQTERRVYPRIRLSFPVSLTVSADEPPLHGMTLDVCLSGMRATFPAYFDLFDRFEIALSLPLVDRDGDVGFHQVTTTAAIVRTEPDEEGPEGTNYEVSLAFLRLEPEHERVIGSFLLQMLLYDDAARLL